MKKGLSLLLALIMAVSLVTPQAWAAELRSTESDTALTETQSGAAETPAQVSNVSTQSAGNAAGLTPHHPHQERRSQRCHAGKGDHAQRQWQSGGRLSLGD